MSRTALRTCAISIILVVAPAQALQPFDAHAEQSAIPSPVSSAWWSGPTNVTQQWGCTLFAAEDVYIPANHSCPGTPPPGSTWHWHHGVDLDNNSTYPSGVGCTDGYYGTGTTLYAGRAGTVSKIATGQFQINPVGTNTYINLVHEQQVLNDPSTGLPIALGAQVTVGEAVVMTGNIAPPGGSSSGCHLHFEVDIGYTYLGANGTGYDVDPTSYLGPPNGSGPQSTWGPGRLDWLAPNSGGNLRHLWFDNGWGAWQQIGISPNIVGTPMGVSWARNRYDLFAVGADGNMLHRGCDNTGCPNPQDTFTPHGAGSYWLDGLTVVSWGPNRIDGFARSWDAGHPIYHFSGDGTTWNTDNIGGNSSLPSGWAT